MACHQCHVLVSTMPLLDGVNVPQASCSAERISVRAPKTSVHKHSRIHITVMCLTMAHNRYRATETTESIMGSR